MFRVGLKKVERRRVKRMTLSELSLKKGLSMKQGPNIIYLLEASPPY